MARRSGQIGRRQFLKGVGAASLAAGAAPLAAWAATKQAAEAPAKAPAIARGSKLHHLQWSSFVKPADDMMRQLAAEWGRQYGVEVTVETINANDLQARVTAAVESKAGPDVIQMLHAWPHLYADACLDVSDVAEPLGKRDGGYYEEIRDACKVRGVWRAVPLGFVALNNAWRVDWFRQNDILKFPDTWDDYIKAGRKLKAFGKPIGQAFGHSFGDPNAFCYPLLWSFGGKEVEKDGKTLALDSKATRESIKFCTAFFKETCDPGGLAWDDTSNNRAYLAGTISSTLNGASIYFVAKNQFPKIAEVTDHDPLPKGPAGRFSWHIVQHHSVMGYSKNPTAAKEWIRWLMDRPQYDRWFTVQRGYTTGPTIFWEENKLWEADRKLIMYRDVNKYGRNPGFPGPPSRAAGEVLAKYIIVDMYARAIQGASPDEAVKWAVGELRQTYGKKA